jgi:hypothetical protein
VQRLRADVDWSHRVTGTSVKADPRTIAADEIECRDETIKNLEGSVERLRGLLREAAEAIRSDQNPSTHYDGCEKNHYKCGLLARIREAAADQPEDVTE